MSNNYELYIIGTENQAHMLSSHLEGVENMFSVNSATLDGLRSKSVELQEPCVFAVFDNTVEDAALAPDRAKGLPESSESSESSESPDEPATVDDFFKTIKKIRPFKKNPFIVITHNEEIDYISRCHDVGAYDVVPDNLAPYEMSFRLMTAVNTYEREVKLKEKLQDAQKVAFDAMEDSSELGRVLQFLTRSNDCLDFVELSQAIFESFEKLHVHGSIMIFYEGEEYYFSDDETIRPIEMRLMKTVHENYLKEVSQGASVSRFLTFNQRIVSVGSSCSMLVRDVSEERQGRMRDILAGIITGLDSRSLFVIGRDKEARRQVLLKKLFSVVRETVDEFQELYDSSEDHTLSVMDDFMLTLSSGMSVLGLTDEQESYFIKAAEEAMNALVSQYTDQIKMRTYLEQILEQMQSLYKAI